MTAYAISLPASSIAPLRAGQISQLRRPGPSLLRRQAGDWLWVREPFHLPREYDALAPTQALLLHPEIAIAFAADGDPAECFGSRRFARCMPRLLCRLNLRIRAVRAERLQDLSVEDARASGFQTIDQFRADWDVNQVPGGKTLSGEAAAWADNPKVAVVTFDLGSDADA